MHSRTSLSRMWIVGVLAGALGCATEWRGPAPRADPVAPDETVVECAASVGTFNIRLDTAADGANAWPSRTDMVVQVLGSAEVWGLQEALPHQVEELTRRLPHMDALWRTRDADPARDESCPILFDRRVWTVDPEEQGTFWLSDEPSVPGSRSWDSSLPRICTYARLIRHGTEPCALYVFNVHLDHRGAVARRESARLLRERIGMRSHPDPVVVVGDFNAGPESPPLLLLLAPHLGVQAGTDPRVQAGSGAPGQPGQPGQSGQSGQSGQPGTRGETVGGKHPDEPLRDAWREANPHAPEQGTFTGWAAAPKGARIDFLLVSPEVRVISASIDASQQEGRWPSDHLPVTARLQLRPARAAAHADE